LVYIFVLIQKQRHFCRGRGSDIHHQLRLYTNGKIIATTVCGLKS